MDFALGSGLSGIDLSSITTGSDQAVLPDVSYGSAAEQPDTPAANGFGTWFTGTLDKFVNLYIAKDAAQMNAMPQYQPAPTAVQPAPIPGTGISVSNKTLLYAGLGVLAFLALRKVA